MRCYLLLTVTADSLDNMDKFSLKTLLLNTLAFMTMETRAKVKSMNLKSDCLNRVFVIN